jgi:hypothetical protein
VPDYLKTIRKGGFWRFWIFLALEWQKRLVYLGP